MKRFNQILVITGGAIYIVLALFNISIGLFLRNNAEFSQLNPAFSKIAQMLNLGVVVFFFSLGIIILLNRKELLLTALGRSILIMSSAFFLIRGAAEFLFEKVAFGLVATMLLISVVFLLPVLLVRKNR